MAHTSQKGEKAKPVVFYFSGPTGCGKDHTIEKLINPHLKKLMIHNKII